MKAVRSSGHSMDLTAGRNGVPASCPGVQIRQDSFNVALYPSFPFVRMERTGSKTREDGRELAVCQVLVRSSFLNGIMMEHATMWESWNRWKTAGFIPSRETPVTPASRTAILWEIPRFMDMGF